MSKKSQIANIFASRDFRISGNDPDDPMSHIAIMTESHDDIDKNGGPNHLGQWMRYRKVKGSELAKLLGGKVTPGMVSDLVNSKRALNAKWLRRIAPHLTTTPGMLLDHDPFSLDSDVFEIWVEATQDQRRTLTDLAKVVVRSDKKTGTND